MPNFFTPPGGNYLDGSYVIFDEPSPRHPVNAAIRQFREDFVTNQIFTKELKELETVLMTLARNERNKEDAFIRARIESIRANAGEDVLKNRYIQRAIEILDSDEEGRLSALYNLTLQAESQLKKMLNPKSEREQDILKKTVYSRSFTDFLLEYLKKGAKDRSSDFAENADDFLNKTLSELIEDYLIDLLTKDAYDSPEFQELITEYRNIILDGLQQSELFGPLFTKNGKLGQKAKNTKIDTAFLSRYMKKHPAVKVSKTGKVKEKTMKQYWTDYTANLFKNELHKTRGLAAEVQSTTQIKGIKLGGMNAKFDASSIISSEYGVSVDTDVLKDIVQNVMENYIGDRSPQALAKEIYNRVLAAMEEMKEDVFFLAVSAKDYRSNMNFEFGSGAAKPFAKRLNSISSILGTGGLIPNMELVLRNIVGTKRYDRAFLYDQREEVLTGIGYLAAAYMFDDIEDMFMQPSTRSLHVYYINGVYFTLSDLLMKLAESLKTIRSQSLVEVTLHDKPGQISEMRKTIRESYENTAATGREPTQEEVDARWEQMPKLIGSDKDKYITLKLQRNQMKDFAAVLRELMIGDIKL